MSPRVIACLVAAGSFLTACREPQCLSFTAPTPLFEPQGPNEQIKEGDPPPAKVLEQLDAGDEVRVLWMSDFKDQVVVRVATDDGREGLVYFEAGEPSLPHACRAR